MAKNFDTEIELNGWGKRVIVAMIDAKTFKWLTNKSPGINEQFAEEHAVYDFCGVAAKGFELVINGKTVCKSLANLKNKFTVKKATYRRKLPFTARKPYCLVYTEEWCGGNYSALAITENYVPSKLKFLINSVPVPGDGMEELLEISGYDGKHGETYGTDRTDEATYYHIVDKDNNRYVPKIYGYA